MYARSACTSTETCAPHPPLDAASIHAEGSPTASSRLAIKTHAPTEVIPSHKRARAYGMPGAFSTRDDAFGAVDSLTLPF